MATLALEAEVREAEERVRFIDLGNRELKGVVGRAGQIVALAFALFEFGTGLGVIGPFDMIVERAVHLMFALALCYALYPFRHGRAGPTIPLGDWPLIAAAVSVAGYVALRSEDIMIAGPGGAGTFEVALGVIAVVLVLEGARRVVGPAMPVLALVLLAYAWVGPLFPGMWAHRQFDLQFLSSVLYFSDRGIFGPITGLSASIVVGFLIFGSMLSRTGGGTAFVDFARLLLGRSTGGPAKVSSLSSALFGTVSGSAVANVIVDGVFNIPLMRRSGYKKDFAAAVEATASSGGQLVPPVMGSAAFIMAEFIGRPYADVALAAVIPAFLYYLGVTSSIHFEALRSNYAKVPEHLIPPAGQVLRQIFRLALPVVALIAFMSAGYTTEYSVFAATLVAMVIYAIGARSKGDLIERGRGIVEALIDGARATVLIAVLIACAEIIIVVVDSTALGVKLSQTITSIAGTSLLLALIFGMLTTLVLGMGVPTPAAYVIGASVVVPALIHLGINTMAAHMFVLYFAVISAITPPVAPAVYAASAIASANWLRAGILAVRLAISAFLVPFLFVYSPALVLQGDPLTIAWRLAVSVVGIVLLSAGVMGYFLRRANVLERSLLVAAGVALIAPNEVADLVGFGLAAVALFVQAVVPTEFWSRSLLRRT